MKTNMATAAISKYSLLKSYLTSSINLIGNRTGPGKQKEFCLTKLKDKNKKYTGKVITYNNH